MLFLRAPAAARRHSPTPRLTLAPHVAVMGLLLRPASRGRVEMGARPTEPGTTERAASSKDDALLAEEVLLRKMLRDRTLSPDVAQAALDALAIKRRRAASTVKTSPANLVQSFALTAERYSEVVQNLGKHVTKSERSTEEREMVREMLGGRGTVFTRDERVGARFESVGWLKNYKLLINQ